MSRRPAAWHVFAVTLILAACGTKEVLLARDPHVPAGLDLSGRWVLQDGAENLHRHAESASDGTIDLDALLAEYKKSKNGKKSSGSKAPLAKVFLEEGAALKITQTPYALFISFDRSVVEEYRFGEHRTVTVGPVDAERASGWENRSYVIETLAKDGTRLVERYTLNQSDTELKRTIDLLKKGKAVFSLEQHFLPKAASEQ